MKKIFMVGFPRSGTTLLQSLLMCDDKIFSFPETHIFTRGNRFKKLPAFLSNLYLSWYCFSWFKKNLGKWFVCYSLNRDKIVTGFFNKLELIAEEKGKHILLEKTPAHLYHIDEIKRLFPCAVFVHVTREHDSALSSISKASKMWGSKDSIFDHSKRWLVDNYISQYYTNNRPDHYLVRFEDVVSDRNKVIELINENLSICITDVTKDRLSSMSKNIVGPEEVWKANNLKGDREIDRDSNTIQPQFKDSIKSIIEKIGR